jgi:hypothetical protein
MTTNVAQDRTLALFSASPFREDDEPDEGGDGADNPGEGRAVIFPPVVSDMHRFLPYGSA